MVIHKYLPVRPKFISEEPAQISGVIHVASNVRLRDEARRGVWEVFLANSESKRLHIPAVELEIY